MSETASFVDPVFLDRFGLARANVLDYFLHPLNPFRTKSNTSNEVLSMQGISIGILMAHGITGREGPMSAVAAEEEYNKALSRLTGEQYELLPPTAPNPQQMDPTNTPQLTTEQLYTQNTPLHTIRHVLRTNIATVKFLGIYYCVEGVIYKAPAVRSLMKTNVARTSVEALSNACTTLASCARFHPATGYIWVFEPSQQHNDQRRLDRNNNDDDDNTIGQYDDEDPVTLMRLARKRRKILDTRRPGERTAAEEEGIRASEAIDQILVRLSKNLSNKNRAVTQHEVHNNINN
jgi:MED6 mediator sub complex component